MEIAGKIKVNELLCNISLEIPLKEKLRKENEDLFNVVETLLKALINFESETPINCSEWKSVEELEESIKAVLA